MDVRTEYCAIMRSEPSPPSTSGATMRWTLFALVAAGTYWFFGETGDVGYLLTLSALARSFALLSVAWAFRAAKKANQPMPVAPDTIRCLCIVGAIRAYSYWRRQGYVPYDPSGDYAFIVVEASGIAGALYAVFVSRKERFAPPPGDALILTSGACLAGMALHADLNKDIISDTLWAVAAYLEVLALVPALLAARVRPAIRLKSAVAFAKEHGLTSPPLGTPDHLARINAAAPAKTEALLDFARAIAICRVSSLGFWSQSFAELKSRAGNAYVGIVVLAVECAAVVLAVELLAASAPKEERKKD